MGKIVLILLVLMGVGAYMGKWYYEDSQSKIMQLQENNATLKANQVTLEEAVKKSNETIAKQQADAAQFQIAQNELRAQLQQAEAYSDELAGKLRRHNLTVLTLQRPGLIETRVNNATAKLFDELEVITGKPAPAPTE